MIDLDRGGPDLSFSTLFFIERPPETAAQGGGDSGVRPPELICVERAPLSKESEKEKKNRKESEK